MSFKLSFMYTKVNHQTAHLKLKPHFAKWQRSGVLSWAIHQHQVISCFKIPHIAIITIQNYGK
jgi:hypothetical protein